MPPDFLETLADAIADGQPIDWDRAHALAADERQRTLVQQLRVVHGIARVHRSTEVVPAAGRLPPTEWRHLQLRSRIAAGAGGEVYRAWDPRLDREVALKLLRPDAPGDLPDAITLISTSDVIHEARLLAKVRHPNVITVFGAERADGCIGIWMELVDGQTVEDFVAAAGPIGPGEAVLLGLTLCRAVAAVHREGLIHRDINARNVVRERGGRIVLMDFGSVREPGTIAHGYERGSNPAYLAPEVLNNSASSAASDIYSLGVLLFYAVSGTYPVEGMTSEAIGAAHTAGRRTYLNDVRPDLPESLVRAIERALAPDPAIRYRTAGEMAEALSGSLAFRSATARVERRRGPGWVAAAAIAAALLVAWVYLATRPATEDPSAFERVTFRQGRVLTARFAPGGLVVYSAEWNGDTREIFSTSQGGPGQRGLDVRDATVAGISSNGEMAIVLHPRFLRGYVESGTLAIAPLGGGAPREITTGVQEADWSPDGGSLAIVREVNGRSRVEYPAGHVLYETGGWVSHLRVSPKGDRIAFIDHPIPADDSGAIAIVDQAGQRRILSAGWSSAQGLAWAPGGDEVWFTAAASGNSRALHATDLRGRVRVIRRGIAKLRLHDIARDGRILVTEESTRVGVMALPPGETRERDLSWLDWSIARDLSRDGRLLLINESGEGGGAHYGIYLRRTDGSPAMHLADGSGMAISPDGSLVLATRPGAEGQPASLVLLPTGPGEPRVLPRVSTRYQQWGTWFPDGQRVVFAGNEPGKGSRVYVQDVRSGLPRAITPEGVYLASSHPLSPDTAMIAAIGPDQVPALFPIDGGPARKVPGTTAGEVPIHWADAHALLVWQRGEAPARIYRVDIATGERTLWKQLMPADPTGVHEILRIVMAADAPAYAYSYTRELSALHVGTGFK